MPTLLWQTALLCPQLATIQISCPRFKMFIKFHFYLFKGMIASSSHLLELAFSLGSPFHCPLRTASGNRESNMQRFTQPHPRPEEHTSGSWSARGTANHRHHLQCWCRIVNELQNERSWRKTGPTEEHVNKVLLWNQRCPSLIKSYKRQTTLLKAAVDEHVLHRAEACHRLKHQPTWDSCSATWQRNASANPP